MCNTCKYQWDTTSISSLIHNGIGCPGCAGKVPWTLERLLERAKKMKLMQKYDFGKVTETHVQNAHSKIPLMCNTCKHQWDTTSIGNLIHHGTGCPKCKKSKMEMRMIDVLQNIKYQPAIDRRWKIVSYIPEWPIKGTKHRCIPLEKDKPNLKDLRADFMITVHVQQCTIPPIIFILELDGAQHFEPVYFGGHFTDDALNAQCELQKQRDQYQDRFCIEHEYRVLRISHSVPLVEYEEVLRYMISQCCNNTTSTGRIMKVCKGDEYYNQ